jgi:hypothetical protein
LVYFLTGLQDFSGLTGLELIMIILKNPVHPIKNNGSFFNSPRGTQSGCAASKGGRQRPGQTELEE